MEQSGECVIAAPREAVWAALNDPDALRACIPGCETFTRTGANAFAARVKAKVGPVSATFQGTVTLEDLDPPAGCRLRVEVRGGGAGFGKGEARVALSEAPGGTLLRYAADATVGGKLAQIGSRLVDAAMRQMAKRFFAALGERLAGGDAAGVPAGADGQAAAPVAAAGKVPGAAPAAQAKAPAALRGRAGKLGVAVAAGLLIWAIVAMVGGAGG